MVKRLLIFITLLFFAVYFHERLEDQRIETSYISGWILTGITLLLCTYSFRKIFTLLGFSISTLRRLHIALGNLAIIALLFHINFVSPNGQFELLLFYFFIFISLTGYLGLILSKNISKKLALKGKEYLYEEIPNYRNVILNKYENIINEAAKNGILSELPADLTENLYLHFSSSKNLINRLFNQNKSSNLLHRELSSLAENSINAKKLANDLIKLVEEKNDLDFSYANQFILKYWALLHAPLISAFFVILLLHIYLVYSFRLR